MYAAIVSLESGAKDTFVLSHSTDAGEVAFDREGVNSATADRTSCSRPLRQ